MNAGVIALPAAELGGKDFFGYFLGHKKVTAALNRLPTIALFLPAFSYN